MLQRRRENRWYGTYPAAWATSSAELISRRGGCTCSPLSCERICERNVAQLPR